MKIQIAGQRDIDFSWPLFADKLEKACRMTGGDISSGELWQMCRSGQAFLLIVHDEGDFVAGIVVQFQKWASKTVLRVLGLAGTRLDEWREDAKAFVAEMARKGGANSIVADGRRGWTRLYDDAKELRITYEVSL